MQMWLFCWIYEWTFSFGRKLKMLTVMKTGNPARPPTLIQMKTWNLKMKMERIYILDHPQLMSWQPYGHLLLLHTVTL